MNNNYVMASGLIYPQLAMLGESATPLKQIKLSAYIDPKTLPPHPCVRSFENYEIETWTTKDLQGHSGEVIDALKELFDGYHNVIFPCGGFAAYAHGLTDKYADIDIYCASHSIYFDIKQKVLPKSANEQRPGVTNTQWIPPIPSNPYNIPSQIQLISLNACQLYWNNNYENIPEEAQDNADHPFWYSLEPRKVGFEDILKSFDVNWSMVGIDLVREKILTHKLANNNAMIVNEDRLGPMLANRMVKYFNRIKGPFRNEQKYRDLVAHLEKCGIRFIEQQSWPSF